ncbi:MAG: DHH family phosphoesterase [candidate division NC10 bacterium]|nr:DHH family phosphoesterase [candidate division NC10 bacterium]
MTTRSRQKLTLLRELVPRRGRVLVLTHDNPDPDSLASAAALRFLLAELCAAEVLLSFGGIVGRAENRALLRYLPIKAHPVEALSPKEFDLLALVDTQPRTGNNSLPPDRLPTIVIDHHPLRRQTRQVPFRDIRRGYGATSTILTEYLRVAGISPDTRLATGLFYAIQSETQDLGREASQADVQAALYLYPFTNRRLLSRIEYSRVPPEYFRALGRVLKNATVHDGVVVSRLGELEYPDMVAEMADLLLRLEDARWAICLGTYGEDLFLSLRTSEGDANAGSFIQKAVGRIGAAGGHGMIAGGRIPLKERGAKTVARLEERLIRRFLRALKVSPGPGLRLVP